MQIPFDVAQGGLSTPLKYAAPSRKSSCPGWPVRESVVQVGLRNRGYEACALAGGCVASARLGQVRGLARYIVSPRATLSRPGGRAGGPPPRLLPCS